VNAGPDANAPVSWFVIERGWKVVAADGSEIGSVEQIVGDSSRDIFDGLTVRVGMFDRERYVPAEQVARITEGRVELRLSADEAGSLRPYDEPAATREIVPVAASWWTRFLDSFRRRR